MIDQDEYDAYEEWKAKKLAGAIDLSVNGFNAEMEALALSWEDGARAALRSVNLPEDFNTKAVLDQNPHRKPGMTGHTPGSRRITT